MSGDSEADVTGNGPVRLLKLGFGLLGMRKLAVSVAIALAALAAGQVEAAPPVRGKVVCGTPHTAKETLFLHQQRLLSDPDLDRRELGSFAPFRDVGDIVVIEATSDIVADPNPLDLSNRSVTIASANGRFSVQTTISPISAVAGRSGVALDLEDDDFVGVWLPFEFPYYGETYTKMYVHSDGNVSFIYPEWSSTTRNFSRVSGGPPRIAPLFRDLDPSKGGQLRLEVFGDRASVTWHQVPVFVDEGEPPGAPQTAQVTLRENGTIQFRYGVVNAADAVVGIFPGAAGEASAVDWSVTGTRSLGGTQALAEVFIDERRLDEFTIAQAFFRGHDDVYDALIVFNDVGFEASEYSLAHAYAVRNEVRGIGEPVFDSGQIFGSPRRLSAFVNMGGVDDYPRLPHQPLPGLPHASMLSILAHEVGHRFLAYTSFTDPATQSESIAILGRQLAHWSFFFNSGASVLEGNQIRDHGSDQSPRFETVAATQTFSKLDQYLMGFLDANEVPAMFLVENPTGSRRLGGPERSPEVGVRFDGDRKEILVDHIIDQEGARRPDATVAQRHFRQAFVLLAEDVNAPSDEALSKLRRLQSNWRAYLNAHTESRAAVQTGLVKMLHLSTWPAGGVVAGSTGSARVEIAEARDTDLTVALTLDRAIARIPSTVTIPAEGLFAEFDVTGIDSGVSNISVRAMGDAGYDEAVTKLVVRADVEGLELERLHRPTVYGVASELVPYELRYRVRDENFVPYTGVELAFAVAGEGVPRVPNARTTFDGEVRVDWTLGSPSSAQSLTASLVGNSATADTTEAVVSPTKPSITASGLVNAASSMAPESGKGFAPGSLVSVSGSGLAVEEAAADALRRFARQPGLEPPEGVPEEFLPSGLPQYEGPGLPLVLAGTSVIVGGLQVPMVSVSPTHATFQVPFGYEEGLTQVLVSTPFGETDAVAFRISRVQPGIFPDRVGVGSSSVVIGSSLGVGTQPKAGGLLEIYATGLGSVEPDGRTGMPGTAVPVQHVKAETTAWVDDEEVDVVSSVLAPLEAGIYRVVIRLPDDLSVGEHQVKIAADGVESNSVAFTSGGSGSEQGAMPAPMPSPPSG